MSLSLRQKLAILADAAKYDASCASSGGRKRTSRDGAGLGSVTGAGICHSYTPDGRCVSLLKILLTNHCVYDCAFCINRRSSDTPRARFTVDEVVTLTLDFYRRNYIEGLFLSSGIIRSCDYTMEELARVAERLRTVHRFRGYIHLKAIPGAAPELLAKAGRFADRLSVNIELPQEESLLRFAPEKDHASIRGAMAKLRMGIDGAKDPKSRARPPAFAPAGQSTQMIVGADGAADRDILATSASLYGGYALKRVYYSAFSPIPSASAVLPLKPPPLVREHRLYQADWMMRFYGFEAKDIVVADDGMLDLTVDPKLAWALANRDRFPVDVNTAPREDLLRVPGLGVKAVDRVLASRTVKSLRLEDVAKLTRSVKSARAFLVASDWTPAALLDRERLRQIVAPNAQRQLELFAA
jgi:putative DNA modification/repair radical SAM protein